MDSTFRIKRILKAIHKNLETPEGLDRLNYHIEFSKRIDLPHQLEILEEIKREFEAAKNEN